MTTALCPTGACPTKLQPISGSLVDGIAAHLKTVHGHPADRARELASARVRLMETLKR